MEVKARRNGLMTAPIISKVDASKSDALAAPIVPPFEPTGSACPPRGCILQGGLYASSQFGEDIADSGVGILPSQRRIYYIVRGKYKCGIYLATSLYGAVYPLIAEWYHTL